MLEGLNTSASGILAATIEPLGGEPRSAFDQMHTLGYRQVQLSATQPAYRPRTLDHSARRDLLATLRRRELTVSGVDLWIPTGHMIDPSTTDRAASAITDAIIFAADMGRVPVSMILPSAEDAGELIAAVTALSEHHGVPIADHAMNIPSDRMGIGVGIDPPVWLGDGKDPIAALLEYGSKLASVRLCDLLRTGDRGPIGTPHDGRLDVAQFRATLDVTGYAGPVVVDARRWVRPIEGMAASRAVWRAAGPG